MELFVKFESFLFIPPSAGSWECLRILKRLGSNKPVCEKWPSSNLMWSPIIEVKWLQLAPQRLFRLCIVCMNMVLWETGRDFPSAGIQKGKTGSWLGRAGRVRADGKSRSGDLCDPWAEARCSLPTHIHLVWALLLVLHWGKGRRKPGEGLSFV